MKLKQKLLGLGLAALLNSGCKSTISDKPQIEEAQRVDAIVMVCETSLNSQIYRNPQTVITMDGIPTYNVDNINLHGIKGQCSTYRGIPNIINAETGQRTPQDCYFTEDNENINWNLSDIRPRDILIKNNKVYTPEGERYSGLFEPCENYSTPQEE